MPEDAIPSLHNPLPLDSDLEAAETPNGTPRPVHLRWQNMALVLLGGSLGTAARYLLSTLIPDWHGIPLGIFMINVAGAFALGCLLEALVRRGPDQGTRRALRLMIGTGMLGGFTTYSSFAVDAAGLIASEQLWNAVMYSAATLVLGAGAAATGAAVAAASHGWRPHRRMFNRANRESKK